MTPRRWLFCLPALVLCVLAVCFAWYFRLPALIWYWPDSEAGKDRLGLSSYRTVIEARPIAGLKNNTSALTYNPQTGTLFTAINHPPQIAELTTDGKLLRTIPVNGAEDLEGITHVRDEFFVLVDERKHEIRSIPVTRQTDRIDLADAPRLAMGIMLGGNIGFEGIAWDEKRQRLFVAKEKTPANIFAIDGLSEWGGKMDLRIREWQAKQPFSRFMRDLSSLSLADTTGNLLLLSDESAMLAEYDQHGELLGILLLWPGWHGLTRLVPQAEGVTVDENGVIYMVSEPNLFYRFERQTGTGSENGAESAAGALQPASRPSATAEAADKPGK
jgi:uncharacterized protein YjiK